MLMKFAKLRESHSLPASPDLDETAGVLRNVKILGRKSKNGREYTAACIKAALPLLEGARVYFDHPDDDSDTRKVSDRFARLRECHVDGKGEAYGNLHFNPHHERAKSFIWFAKNDPAGLGLSINGNGTGTVRSDGTRLVEQITKIVAVDIVDGPATTEGLFEQEGYTPPDDPQAQLGGNMEPNAEPAANDTDTDFRAKLADLASHVVGDESMSASDILAKLKQIVAMIETEVEGEGDAEPEAEPDEEKAMEQLGKFSHPAAKWAYAQLGERLKEQKRVKLTAQAREAGVPPLAITPTFLDALLREQTDEGRNALIADRKAVATGSGSGPRYTPRDEPAAVRPQSVEDLVNRLFTDEGGEG